MRWGSEETEQVRNRGKSKEEQEIVRGEEGGNITREKEEGRDKQGEGQGKGKTVMTRGSERSMERERYGEKHGRGGKWG